MIKSSKYRKVLFFTSVFVLAVSLLVFVTPTFANVIGEVLPNEGVKKLNQASGGEIGLIFFFSRVVQLFIVVAGIASMFNFIYAGIMFITSAGDTSVYGKVKDKLTYGVLGMVVLASAFTIAGLVGLVFFGDPTYILSPELYIIEPAGAPPPCGVPPC